MKQLLKKTHKKVIDVAFCGILQGKLVPSWGKVTCKCCIMRKNGIRSSKNFNPYLRYNPLNEHVGNNRKGIISLAKMKPKVKEKNNPFSCKCLHTLSSHEGDGIYISYCSMPGCACIRYEKREQRKEPKP